MFDPKHTKEDLRKSLRVIRGGKAATPEFHPTDLNHDKFLRNHYLGSHPMEKSSHDTSITMPPQMLLWGMDDFPDTP